MYDFRLLGDLIELALRSSKRLVIFLLPFAAIISVIMPFYTIYLKNSLEFNWREMRYNEMNANFESSACDSKIWELFEQMKETINSGTYTEEEKQEKYKRNKEYYKYTGCSPLSGDYEILKVSKTASNEEIKKAFSEQIKKWHPDVCRKNGIPIEVGKEHTQKVVQSYKNIRAQRGF